MIRLLLIGLGAIALGISNQGIALAATKCPPAPEQTSIDYDADISGAVETFKRLSGVELRAKAAGVAKDLMGRLPGADRVYIEQMMYASYCSALYEDKTLSDSERREELKKYNSDVRKAMEQHQASKVEQPAVVPPAPKPPRKKKAGGPQSNVNPPVSQKLQPAVPQSPTISQQSAGAFSPNVAGDGNIVIINPASDAKLDEIKDMFRQTGHSDDPSKLLQKYPLGYAIYDLTYMNQVTPYEKLSALINYETDWSEAKIQNTTDRFVLRLPTLKRRGGTEVIKGTRIEGPKKVGLSGWNETEGLAVCGEILAIRENGIVFLVHLKQLAPYGVNKSGREF